MTADLRLGMIGAGWIADRHLQSVSELPQVSVVAVADLDRTRAERVASAAGAAVHDDWRTMLDREQMDAVMVLTPPLAHREPLEAAVERGLPVYLEKPVARTHDDAVAIAGAVRRAGALVAVGYQYRALDFLPDLAAAATADPLGVLASYSVGATAGRPWFVQQAQGGGQVLERASHHIDLQRAIGGEIDWVQAAGSQVDLAGDQRPVGSDIDDVIALTLGFRLGALGTVLVAWTQPGLPSRYTLDLVSAGSAVRVELDPSFSATGVRGGAEVSLRTGAPPIQRGLERFLDAVRAGDPGLVACTVEQAAGTLEVALACERALAGGGRVTVES
jgi:myo-inositol 2-dehydrogenase/D-chiro-inositol 1-dehydrogenase